MSKEYGKLMEGLFKGAVVGTAVVTAAVVGGSVILGKKIKDKIEESSNHDNNQINVQPDTLLRGDTAGDNFHRGELKEVFNMVSNTVISNARGVAHDVQELTHVITELRSPYALISLAYQRVKGVVETVDEALTEPNNHNATSVTEDNSLFSGDLAGWDFENIL